MCISQRMGKNKRHSDDKKKKTGKPDTIDRRLVVIDRQKKTNERAAQLLVAHSYPRYPASQHNNNRDYSGVKLSVIYNDIHRTETIIKPTHDRLFTFLRETKDQLSNHSIVQQCTMTGAEFIKQSRPFQPISNETKFFSVVAKYEKQSIKIISEQVDRAVLWVKYYRNHLESEVAAMLMDNKALTANPYLREGLFGALIDAVSAMTFDGVINSKRFHRCSSGVYLHKTADGNHIVLMNI